MPPIPPPRNPRVSWTWVTIHGGFQGGGTDSFGVGAGFGVGVSV